jgi:hypothetical protein
MRCRPSGADRLASYQRDEEAKGPGSRARLPAHFGMMPDIYTLDKEENIFSDVGGVVG